MKSKGVRIFRDIHVSGHAAREDHRDLITLLKPKYIIPSHGNREKALEMLDLAQEMGYVNDQSLYIMENGKRLKFDFSHFERLLMK